MAKYHFSESTGKASVCTAQPGNCPMGQDTPHYGSKEEAIKGAENILSEKHDVLSSNHVNNNSEELKTIQVNNLVNDFVNSDSNNFDLNHDNITSLAKESLPLTTRNKIEKYGLDDAYKVANMTYVFNCLAEKANDDPDTKDVNFKLEHSAFNSDVYNTEKSIRSLSTSVINMMISVEETHAKRKDSDKNNQEYEINKLLIKNMSKGLEKEIIAYRDFYNSRKQLSDLLSSGGGKSNHSKYLDKNIVEAHAMMMRSGMRRSQLETMSDYSGFLQS